MTTVYDKCKCGCARRNHDVAVRPNKKGFMVIKYLPYSRRYTGMCRKCPDCNKFEKVNDGKVE